MHQRIDFDSARLRHSPNIIATKVNLQRIREKLSFLPVAPALTSITCSARSFGEASSSSSFFLSSSSVAPRRLVPAIGCVVTRPFSTLTSCSGDAPTTCKNSRNQTRSIARLIEWCLSHLESIELQIEHVRRRIDNAKLAVDVECADIVRKPPSNTLRITGELMRIKAEQSRACDGLAKAQLE